MRLQESDLTNETRRAVAPSPPGATAPRWTWPRAACGGGEPESARSDLVAGIVNHRTRQEDLDLLVQGALRLGREFAAAPEQGAARA